MERPLITVIVGIYNGQKFLAECIESIIHQDYTNIEIILVDDGSKDDSAQIIDEFASKDARIIPIHQQNAGVSASRNSALAIAKGEYICIMDQDDVLAPDYVNYFYGLIEKSGAEVALTPNADKFFEKVHPDSERVRNNDQIRIISGEQAAIEMLYHKYVIAPWNKMISKKLIDDNGLKFNTKYYNGEGFAFSIESFLCASKVAVGHRHVYHYRVGDPNTGASVFKLQYIHSSIEAQQYIKSTFKNPSSELMKAWRFSNWHTHCDAFNVFVGCSAKNKDVELYNSIRSFCKENANCAFEAPISMQQKFRGLLFKLSPFFAAKFINRFRVRKFKKV